jgi:hypothetical protein
VPSRPGGALHPVTVSGTPADRSDSGIVSALLIWVHDPSSGLHDTGGLVSFEIRTEVSGRFEPPWCRDRRPATDPDAAPRGGSFSFRPSPDILDPRTLLGPPGRPVPADGPATPIGEGRRGRLPVTLPTGSPTPYFDRRQDGQGGSKAADRLTAASRHVRRPPRQWWDLTEVGREGHATATPPGRPVVVDEGGRPGPISHPPRPARLRRRRSDRRRWRATRHDPSIDIEA